VNRRWRGIGLRWRKKLRSLLSFLPLILASILIALLATRAESASTYCLFQSPIGPTSTPRVLRAVATPPNFVPWVIGLLVITIVVGAILYWRSRREGGDA